MAIYSERKNIIVSILASIKVFEIRKLYSNSYLRGELSKDWLSEMELLDALMTITCKNNICKLKHGQQC